MRFPSLSSHSSGKCCYFDHSYSMVSRDFRRWLQGRDFIFSLAASSRSFTSKKNSVCPERTCLPHKSDTRFFKEKSDGGKLCEWKLDPVLPAASVIVAKFWN